MNVKIAIGILTVVILVFAAYWLLFAQNNSVEQTPPTAETAVTENTQTNADQQTQTKERPPLSGPEDWNEYWNDEWGIAFRYPASWALKELPNSVRKEQLGNIHIIGQGYDALISKGGGGLPEREWTHPPYTIAGEQARTWQTESGTGFMTIISVQGFRFTVVTPDKTKELSDKLLETVKLY